MLYILRPGLFLPTLIPTEDETEVVLLGLPYVDQRADDALTRAAGDARPKINVASRSWFTGTPPHGQRSAA